MMRTTGTLVGSRTGTSVIALVTVALVVGGVGEVEGTADSTPVAQSGGSLPLKGDELASGDGGRTDQHGFGTGSHWNVLNWAPGELAAVPASYSFNTVNTTGRTVKKVFVSSQANPDVGTASSVINMSFSEDSGRSFLTTQRNFPTSALNMTRLTDGSLLAIDFIPEWGDAARTFTNLKVRTSKDGGQTWNLRDAPVTMPDDMQLGPMSNGLRVHRRILALPDGTLMVPIYTIFKGAAKGVSAILQSADQGASWSLRSVIPIPESMPATNEVGWSYTSDGRLLAVMRTGHTPVTHLVQSFSDDDGKTWTEAAEMNGPDGEGLLGIYPDVVLQPNGTMLLTAGRPDVKALVSNDGTGQTWDNEVTVFANYPSTGNNGRYDGSSGNNTMENVASNRSILYYDQCHVWGCGAYNEQFGVSAEYVSAVTPGVGRIDVASKLIDGTAAVSGSFSKAVKAFPEMRPEGAFDGSSDYGAEARLVGARGAAGELVLKLDDLYSLNRVGLMLGHGAAQSATVSLSEDGQTWSAPVVDAQDRTDRAMRYTDFPAQDARYVKVVGAAGTTTTLTELELYSANVDTFENELPFSVPRGWTDAEHTWVTDVPGNDAYTEFGGHHSQTALRLWDKWTDSNAHIVRPTPSTQHLYASMQWGVGDARARFTFGALGTGADGSQVKAWNFRVSPGNPARLEAFDGSAWVTVGPFSKPLPTRAYLPLTINATTETTTVSFGSETFSTEVRAAEVTDLDGLHFSTGDPEEYGGTYFLDDVAVSTDPGEPPALGPIGFDPAQVTPGEPVTVSTTITNAGSKDATDASAELQVPDGWSVAATQAPTEIDAGQSAPVSWTLTAPSDTPVGTYSVRATATYRSGDARMTATSPVVPLYLGVVPQDGMAATATTAQSGAAFAPSNTIDGNPATIWHSQYTPAKDVPPQSITFDLGGVYDVTGLTYLPRQDATTNGSITTFNVYTSTDGDTFTQVGSGQWDTAKTAKTTSFEASPGARFVRLEATAAVGDYISAAEINVIGSGG